MRICAFSKLTLPNVRCIMKAKSCDSFDYSNNFPKNPAKTNAIKTPKPLSCRTMFCTHEVFEKGSLDSTVSFPPGCTSLWISRVLL